MPALPTLTALADAVRRRRAELGLTQTDVADLAGVSDRFVRSLEQGKESAHLGKAVAVLAVLGLDLTVRLRR